MLLDQMVYMVFIWYAFRPNVEVLIQLSKTPTKEVLLSG